MQSTLFLKRQCVFLCLYFKVFNSFLVRENDFAAECSTFQPEMLRSFETLTCAYQTKRSELPKGRYLNSHRYMFIYVFFPHYSEKCTL